MLPNTMRGLGDGGPSTVMTLPIKPWIQRQGGRPQSAHPRDATISVTSSGISTQTAGTPQPAATIHIAEFDTLVHGTKDTLAQIPWPTSITTRPEGLIFDT